MVKRRGGGVPLPVRIASDTGWAWRGDERLDLPPKMFAVLRHLVENPERLITKDELLSVGWGDTVVSEAALTSCIRDLRRALDDSSRAPRYIETVHRRGFRFIGPVGTPRAALAAGVPIALAPAAGPLVGRDAELARLHATFARATAGERCVVFVTGEAGIGKTTLVERFVAELGGAGGVRVGRGQCVEQYGASEPYLPLLEALGRLGREAQGDALVRVLKQYAPGWLAQLPALLSDEDLASVQQRAYATTRERMLRELVEALDAVGADAPFVLVLEDLHWSDAGTVDLLAMLARRPDRARLLIVGTYRSADLAAAGHPLHAAVQELQAHGRCEALALDVLPAAAVADYLARRLSGAEFASALAPVLQANTNGNPLFLVNLVDDLIAQGQLCAVDDEWRLMVPLDAVSAAVPRTLAQMIDKQIDRLPPLAQAVLAVGSVAGAEFSAALAAVDGVDARDGEQACGELARRGHFVRALGVAAWPDGTVAGRYGFVHAMYRNVLYDRVPIGHRVGLHLRIGARLEEAHGARAPEIAGELAMHFERGRDFARAIRYRRLAADTALRQHGHRESIDHARRALALLAALPESAERDASELAVQTVLGAASVAMSGWVAPEVAAAYERARVLCGRTGMTPQLFPVLLGLGGFTLMRGQIDVAREVSRQFFELAAATDDAAIRLGAENTAGMTAFYSGRFREALGHFERARAIYDPERHSPNRLRTFSVDHDPGVSCTAHGGLTLMMLGYHDRGAASMRASLDYANAIDHPLSVAMAYNFAATLYLFRREPDVVRELEAVRLAYSRKHDFDVFLMLGEIYRGWLLAEEGRLDDAASVIANGVSIYQAVGAELGRPTFLGVLAEVQGRLDRIDEGLATIADAVDLAERTGLHYWDAELRRLRGTLLARGGSPSEAEACFEEALAIARRQDAKAPELRAAIDLARLAQARGKRTKARALLSEVYGWFDEGLTTPDLVAAKALLER